MSNKNEQPIGIFDSGVGGLTVLSALKTALPNESFLYLGDTAHLPYGTKSPEAVIHYAQQASQTLVDRSVKMLVVACNTASTIALETIEATYPHLPVIGVLKPGAQAAVAASKTGDIAVIATEATVRSGGYQAAIQALNPSARVRAMSASVLVALAEEGWVNGDVTQAALARYLSPLLAPNETFDPDCLLLGCTHFPVFLDAIKAVVGQRNIAVIDPAQRIAKTLEETLLEKNLVCRTGMPKYQFLVTDAPDRFAQVAQRFLADERAAFPVELIHLAR